MVWYVCSVGPCCRGVHSCSVVKVPHEGNPLPQAAKIITCACRNGFSMANTRPEHQIQHRQKTVSWSSELSDELTRGLRACRVL